jgi:iron-sulfur cluster repair protein YtfE (RIC family)
MTDDIAYLAQVKAEHYGLEQILLRLGEHFDLARASRWDPSCASRLVALLEELSTQIERHFAQEEVGGYMEEALSRAPRFSAQAATLLKQHIELALEVHELLARAKVGSENPKIWEMLYTDVQTLVKKLSAHEAGENRIVEAAFNEDLGLADWTMPIT